MVDDAVTRLLDPTTAFTWVCCPVCEGNPTLILTVCPGCQGAGCFLMPPHKPPPKALDLLICAACDGTGMVQDKTCSTCQGAKRIFVQYREAAYVRYERTNFSAGHSQHCDNGYTWCMVPCPVCTGDPTCEVCLGTSWIPSTIAEAIDRFLRPLPPGMPPAHITRYIRCNLDQIARMIPHGVPTKRIA